MYTQDGGTQTYQKVNHAILILITTGKRVMTCADLENFVGGPTLTTCFLIDEERKVPNTTRSEPTSVRQQNAIQVAFRWRADDGSNIECCLSSFMLFQGIRISIA